MGSIRLYGSTSGYLELQAPAVAPDAVLTLPSDSVQPGLVHLHTETFSAVSSVSIDNVFSAEYNTYETQIVFTGQSADATITARYRASGTDTTSGYVNRRSFFGTGTTTGGSDGANTTAIDLANQEGSSPSNFRHAVTLNIYNPTESTRTLSVGQGVRYGSDGNFYVDAYATTLNDTTSYDGFSVLASGGTVTGTIRIYGYRNS